ncbi:MAG TPA: hypothetical protein PKE30_07095 [Niabella sp.]|nr:hypothetical protein [Niabella sp.]
MKNGLVFLSFFLFTAFSVKAQTDVIYTVSNYTSPGIRQITGVDPNTGLGTIAVTSYATGDNTTLSAAMALANNGYLYYIPYTESTGNNGGVCEIRSISATTSATLSGPVHSEDVNGASATNVTFRTMALASDGWIYLTFSDGTSNISLAKFQPNTTGGMVANSFTLLGSITINGSAPASNLRNGDIAFDGNGNLYALINEDDAGGNAVIYFAPNNAISTTSGGSTNLITKYNVVKPGGGNFSEYVVGLAVASSGNFYIAVQDDHAPSQGGVYLLTRNSTDNELVISSSPISDANARDIADLATNYFPPSTILPVVYGPIFAKIANGSLEVNWSTFTETNNDHFEIEISADGQHFVNIGTVNTKALDGNSDTTIYYSFTKTVDVPVAVMGISLLSLAVVLLLVNRKNRLLFSLMMVMGIGLSFASCSKNGEQVDVSGEGKLFVRIIQVDKDGTKSVTDALTAYRAD